MNIYNLNEIWKPKDIPFTNLLHPSPPKHSVGGSTAALA